MNQYRPLAPVNSQSQPFGGFMPMISRNSDALLQAGMGLLSGRTPQEQAALGFQGFAQGRKLNMTLDYLDKNYPEFAQAARAGVLTPSEALIQANASRTKKAPLEINGRLVDPDTYQVLADFSDKPKADDYTVRQQQAQQLGMTPDDPRYQSYILTGKFPREDAQPLTATDKKAILEADEAVSTNEGAISTIDRALDVNKQANSGWFANARATVGNRVADGLFPDWLSSPESSKATIEYDNLVQNQALQQLKTIFGGNPTEGERAILLDLQASSDKDPETREKILIRARDAAIRRLEFNRQRSEQMRGGTYYKPGGGVTSAPAGNRTATGVQWKVK